jgi:hypothetical protein
MWVVPAEIFSKDPSQSSYGESWEKRNLLYHIEEPLNPWITWRSKSILCWLGPIGVIVICCPLKINYDSCIHCLPVSCILCERLMCEFVEDLCWGHNHLITWFILQGLHVRLNRVPNYDVNLWNWIFPRSARLQQGEMLLGNLKQH